MPKTKRKNARFLAEGKARQKSTPAVIHECDEDAGIPRDRPPQLTDNEYDRLIEILLMPVCERAKQHRDGILYRKAKRHKLIIQTVSDPYRGEELLRLTRNGLIILPPREIDNCVAFYHRHSFGDGAKKLWSLIKNSYSGISKNTIIQKLSQLESHSKTTPRFCNKAPLGSTRASKVMERHQIDLVEIKDTVEKTGDSEIQYVLLVMDCFSRFLWLRVISDKRAETIVKELEKIYFEFGPPQILASDQGYELKEELNKLCSSHNFKLIHWEYHGKIDKSQGTWRPMLKALVYKLLQRLASGESLTKALPLIARNYNNGFHSALKMSPYECLFGIKSNFITQTYAGGLCEDAEGDFSCLSQVVERNSQRDSIENHTDCDDTCSVIKRRRIEFDNVRLHLLVGDSDSKHDKTVMDKPSYDIGEIVNVKYKECDRAYQYQAIIRGRKAQTYTVMLISDSRHGEVLKVNGDNIVSLTLENERDSNNHKPELTKSTMRNALYQLKDLEMPRNRGVQGKEGLVTLSKNAALKGLQIDSDNLGSYNSSNGDCLFLALQQQLKVNGVTKTYLEIRQEIVNFLSNNFVIGEGKDAIYLPDFVTGYSSWEEYLDDLRKDGVWGDNIVLVGAAELYQISICVVSSLNGADPIVIVPSSDISLFDINLGHICETHYVTLSPKNLCEMCGSLSGECACQQLASVESSLEALSRIIKSEVISNEHSG